MVRTAALSLAGIRIDIIGHYRSDMVDLLKKDRPRIAVLPAYSALLLGRGTGALLDNASFTDACLYYLENSTSWNEQYLTLHSNLAREADCYLVSGTIFEEAGGHFYHSSCCFDPRGELLALQRQTHLTAEERELGLSKGEELSLFAVDELQAGLVVGNDARHPEVGRIFALRGADILLHSGALDARLYCWPQAAGIWAQVQQNQTWAVEAQLRGTIGKRSFGASSAVIAPCEITPGQSGYLARGYPDSPMIGADLDQRARRAIKEKYPLLKLLNPAAYKALFE